MKDGRHIIMGRTVIVEDGMIVRGIKNPGWNETVGYVYRLDRKLRCWTSEGKITVAAFRAGVRRGTVDLK